jgi:hypothetical protein
MQTGDEPQQRRNGHWRSTLWKVLFRAGLQAALVLGVLIVNPFDVTRWTGLRHHDLWERIQAPSYRDDIGRNAVSIVYLDEQTLADAGWARPIKLRQHEAMLDDVARTNRPGEGPEAIFIDFAFDGAASQAEAAAAEQPYGVADLDACARASDSIPAGQPGAGRFRCYWIKVASLTHYPQWADDPTCSSNDLARLLCIRRSGGIPIIFPTGEKPEAGAGASPALTALSRVALVTSADMSSAHEYWLVSPDRLAERQNQPFHLSPAAALYAVFCYDEPHSCRSSPVGAPGVGAPEWTKAFERPVQVRWGLGTDDAFTQRQQFRHSGALAQRCIVGQGWLGGAKEAGKLSAYGLKGPQRLLGCAFTHATPYVDFDSARITDRDLNDIVTGKLVLIGGQFSDSNDWVSAPPHGQLPGLYYHAMTLDNLIKYNSHYPAAPRPFLIFPSGWADVITVVCAFAIGTAILSVKVILNEPSLDPAQSSASAMTLLRLFSRGAGLKRFSLYLGCSVVILGAAAGFWFCDVGDYDSAMLALVLLAGLPALTREWLRPLTEGPSAHSIAAFLDVSDARWWRPDVNENVEGPDRRTTTFLAYELKVKEEILCAPEA